MNLCGTSDFSYDHFRSILRTIKSNFESHLLSEVPQIMGEFDKSKLILRHDIDVSLKKALAMAQIEKDFGIRTNYMVMTESWLYNTGGNFSRDILQKIMNMEHEIGLHISPSTRESITLEAKINSACKELEKVIGQRVKAFSYHRPREKDRGGPLKISNRVNAYASELWDKSEKMGKRYLSDSGGRWKYGEPLPWLKESDVPLRQLLIHPIWWGNASVSREERLRAFVSEETNGKPLDCRECFRRKVICTIGVEFYM